MNDHSKAQDFNEKTSFLDQRIEKQREAITLANATAHLMKLAEKALREAGIDPLDQGLDPEQPSPEQDEKASQQQQELTKALALQAEAIEKAACFALDLNNEISGIYDTNDAWEGITDLLHFSNEEPDTHQMAKLMQIMVDKANQQTEAIHTLTAHIRHTLAAAQALAKQASKNTGAAQ